MNTVAYAELFFFKVCVWGGGGDSVTFVFLSKKIGSNFQTWSKKEEEKKSLWIGGGGGTPNPPPSLRTRLVLQYSDSKDSYCKNIIWDLYSASQEKGNRNYMLFIPSPHPIKSAPGPIPGTPPPPPPQRDF